MIVSLVALCFLALVAGSAEMTNLTAPSLAAESIGSSPNVDGSLVQIAPAYALLAELYDRQLGQRQAPLPVDAQCRADAERMMLAVNRQAMWSLKALDASGSMRSGFVWGQRAWIGSPEQCAFLNDDSTITLTADIPKTMHAQLIDTKAPFAMDYRMVFSNFSSPFQIDALFPLRYLNRLGVCMPSSCGDDDIALIAQSLWTGGRLRYMRLFGISATVVRVRSMHWTNFTRLPAVRWIGGSIGALVALVLVLGSVRSDRPLLQCFSLRQNFGRTFDLDRKPNAIGALSGIRSVVCIWVTVLHAVFYTSFAYDNLAEVLHLYELFAQQIVFAALLFVDVFFVLGAVVLTYNFLGNTAKLRELRDAPLRWVAGDYLRRVLHRYVRLTPVLLFAMALSHCVALYVKEASSYYADEQFDLYCSGTGWWKALLYIQNMNIVSDMCGTWTWYIACDLQFFAVILLLLYVYARHPKTAVALFVLLCAVSLGVCFTISYDLMMTPKIDALLANLTTFYVPPWMRIVPYLVGAINGALLHGCKAVKFRPSAWLQMIYWLLYVAIFALAIVVNYFKDIPMWMYAAGFSFGRFALWMFWISTLHVFALGMAGSLNRWLSNSLFVHFDRLTYMIYMLNPILVTAFDALSQGAEHFDYASTWAKSIAMLFVTYGAAILATPLIEIPFHRLSDRYILGRKS